MYGRVKLTKRQIKEDKFTTFMLGSKQQLQENWQYVAIGVIVVVLAIVGITYYLNSIKESAHIASGLLSRANLEYRQGNSQVAVLTYTDLINKYDGTTAAEQATFMLGSVNLQTRNYPEAIRYFQLYLDKYNDHSLNCAAARSGIGISLENQGNFLEAAESFDTACVEFPDSPLLADLHAGAMRNYLESGNIDKAREHLDAITEKFEGSELANKAARLFYEKSPTS